MAGMVTEKKVVQEQVIMRWAHPTGQTNVVFEKEHCPDCGGRLIPEGRCMFCPNCGWSACG